MKKSILLLVCMATLLICLAQERHRSRIEPGSPAGQYLQKARSQKTAAIILISTGGLLVVVGTVTGVQSLDFSGDLFGSGSYGGTTSSNSDETVSTVLILAGLAAMLSSIGFFVASHKNKNKALKMSLQNEQVLLFPQHLQNHRSMPAWGLRFNF